LNNITLHKDAVMDLVVLADAVVARQREELAALITSSSDAGAVEKKRAEVERLASSADRLRPFAN
jgi:hypothetical protein